MHTPNIECHSDAWGDLPKIEVEEPIKNAYVESMSICALK